MHRFLFTFYTTHQALKAEKCMKKEESPSRLIPTPTEIFAECGFSLELELDETALQDLLKGEAFVYAECYLIAKNEEGCLIYEKIHY